MGQIVTDVTSILDNRNAKKEAENEKKEILEEIKKDEAEKVNLVNKALATQRAKTGAAGVSKSSLTQDAVLERLREETEQPFDDKKSENLKKINSIKANTTNVLTSILGRLDDLLG